MAELRRTLGVWMTSAFVFLNLVNTGIFLGVQVGFAAAGPASIIAWIALGLVSIYAAMCFSELTTMFPKAGGVYEFAKQVYGSFISFEVGWLVWVINNIATALLTVAAVTYLVPDISLTIGSVVIDPALTRLLIIIAAIVIMNLVVLRGADDSAKLMLMLSIFTFSLFLVLIIPGIREVHASTFTGLTWHWPAILVAAFLLSETFYGWESISFMAEEIKNPEKTIPKALIGTAVFVAISSVLIAIITISVLGGKLGGSAIERPISAVLENIGFVGWLLIFANIGVVCTFLGNAVGGVMGNPRLLMALSRDKLFIEQFADIHPKYQTPHRAIILQMSVTLIIAILASGAYEQLLELLAAPSITLYAATIFLVPYLRWTRPEHERPYKTPFGSFLPLFLVAFFLSILAAWTFYDPASGTMTLSGNPGALGQLRLLASFMLLSAPIYLLLLYFYNPDVLITTINRFAVLNLWLENLLVPKRLRREILELIPDAHGKHLIELGSGVGSLTMHLAEHVGKEGRISAIDFSEGNTKILQRRMTHKGHGHVHVIHDPHLISRIHPGITRVDIAVSIGHLGYAQDPQKALRDLYDLLPHHGRICFVEYTDFFWFLPNNPKWLSDPEKIREIFSEAGFSIDVRVRKGLFWKYVFIYGIKDKQGARYI